MTFDEAMDFLITHGNLSVNVKINAPTLNELAKASDRAIYHNNQDRLKVYEVSQIIRNHYYPSGFLTTEHYSDAKVHAVVDVAEKMYGMAPRGDDELSYALLDLKNHPKPLPSIPPDFDWKFCCMQILRATWEHEGTWFDGDTELTIEQKLILQNEFLKMPSIEMDQKETDYIGT